MQELELKMQGGGLMREGGGVIAGFYGTFIFSSLVLNIISETASLTLTQK